MRLKHWWAGKYKLPPNHPLFEKQSVAELVLEQYEDLYYQRAELEASLEVLSGDALREAERRIVEIGKSLGEKVEDGDDLIDKWERELAEGKIPNLEERPDGH